jgi:hypothetical protein
MEKIYEMKLHESIMLDDFGYVKRVPGGWIYKDVSLNGFIATTFVPYNREFLPTEYNKNVTTR